MAVRSVTLVGLGLIATAGFLAVLVADEVHHAVAGNRWRQHDIRRPKPPVVEPSENAVSVPAPKDAIVLFNGNNLDAWQAPGGGPARWKVADGSLEITPGTGPIETRDKFGDVQLHVEWASPNPPTGTGQDRGNSGIFLMGLYEIQVLDSYRADTYADGQAGAIYGEYPPLSNASRPPGEWQTYDIAFRRPRFDPSGKLQEPARVTLIHNGILVQNNEELFGPTAWLEWLPYEAQGDRGSIQLQDHGHRVRFRNIWLRNLPARPEPTPKDLERPKVVSVAPEALDSLVGLYLFGTEADAPRVSFARRGGHLVFKLPFRPGLLELQPISPTEFVMPRTDGRFRFQKDDQGRVTGAVFAIGDGERTLRKVEP